MLRNLITLHFIICFLYASHSIVILFLNFRKMGLCVCVIYYSGHLGNSSIWKFFALSPKKAFWIISFIIERSQFSCSFFRSYTESDVVSFKSKLTYYFLFCIFVNLLWILLDFSQLYFSTFLLFLYKSPLSSFFFISKSAFLFYDCLFYGPLFFMNAIFSFITLKIIKFFMSKSTSAICNACFLRLHFYDCMFWFLSARLGTFLKHLSIFGTRQVY